jgi:hypothetical protein
MLTIASKSGQYTKNGQPIFVYTLAGESTDLKDYKTSQGDYYRESEDKKPLYFSQRICSIGANLEKTRSGRYTVLADLEQKAAELESASNSNYGKLLAIQQFTGLTKAQLTERLLASF